MKKDEKDQDTSIPWIINDPKPPVIQSGHMENHRRAAGVNSCTVRK